MCVNVCVCVSLGMCVGVSEGGLVCVWVWECVWEGGGVSVAVSVTVHL